MKQQFIEKIPLGQNNDEVEVLVRKSARAKRVSLKINIENRIELVVPSRVSIKKAIAFLHQQRVWLENKMNHQDFYKSIPFTHGKTVPVAGNECIIHHTGNIRGVSYIKDNILYVSGLNEHIPSRVKSHLNVVAKDNLTELSVGYANQLNVSIKNITLRDTKTRWGSCSHRGALSFSWRLVLAPYEVMAYVAAHEVAHLREMNHSQRFWKLVESICPDYQQHRDWLKKHGRTLQLYGMV